MTYASGRVQKLPRKTQQPPMLFVFLRIRVF